LKGSFSVRFPSVLTERERADLSTSFGALGARIASWNTCAPLTRTYARVDYAGRNPAPLLRERFSDARIDAPPIVVLALECSDAVALGRILAALRGSAAPIGTIAAEPAPWGAVIELDDTRTPLSLGVDLNDVEAARARCSRRLRPLVQLADRTITRFAAAILATADLDETRLIETYSEPLLRGEAH
jgi:hypothetical protein